MELGVSPAQIDDIEPEMLALMRAHAHRLRVQEAVLLMMAFHDPKKLGKIVDEMEDPVDREQRKAQELLKVARDMQRRFKHGNS